MRNNLSLLPILCFYFLFVSLLFSLRRPSWQSAELTELLKNKIKITECRGQAECMCMFSLLPSLDSVPYHLSHCDVHATGERGHLSAISYCVRTQRLLVGGSVEDRPMCLCHIEPLSIKLSRSSCAFCSRWKLLPFFASLVFWFLWHCFSHSSTNT